MLAGIRIQHPAASDEQVFAMIEKRLALARKQENGVYEIREFYLRSIDP